MEETIYATLTDGGYDGFCGTTEPQEIKATKYTGKVNGYDISGAELIRLGANPVEIEEDYEEYYFYEREVTIHERPKAD